MKLKPLCYFLNLQYNVKPTYVWDDFILQITSESLHVLSKMNSQQMNIQIYLKCWDIICIAIMFIYSSKKNPYIYISPFEFGYIPIFLYRALLFKEINTV